MSLNTTTPIPTRPIIDTEGKVTLSSLYQAWFNGIQQWLGPVGQFGATSARPTKNLYIGLSYFDTTLGYPVFLKQVSPSNVWVNASGTPV
jgi:hypothetical protein